MEPKIDCRFYVGDKPCRFKRICMECPEYAAKGICILVLKLGAMGDALRTTPILSALKDRYPVSWITWVTDSASYPILKDNPLIDRLLRIDMDNLSPLLAMEYDLLLSYDKDILTTSLAMRVNAVQKRGFGLSRWGTLDILNESSRYAWALGLDDDLKFYQNTKTYQEMIFEMGELPYRRYPYIYNLPEKDHLDAIDRVDRNPAPGNGPRIGLNTGCGSVFATKKWADKHFISLAGLLRENLDARVYLLGGESERVGNAGIAKALNGQAVDTGVNNLDDFAGLLSAMDLVVTGDTMALHLALAVKTKTLGLFGPTCHQEIDFYGQGRAIVSKTDCTPCYRSKCIQDESCMDDIQPGEVMETIQSLLENPGTGEEIFT